MKDVFCVVKRDSEDLSICGVYESYDSALASFKKQIDSIRENVLNGVYCEIDSEQQEQLTDADWFSDFAGDTDSYANVWWEYLEDEDNAGCKSAVFRIAFEFDDPDEDEMYIEVFLQQVPLNP